MSLPESRGYLTILVNRYLSKFSFGGDAPSDVATEPKTLRHPNEYITMSQAIHGQWCSREIAGNSSPKCWPPP